MKRFQHHNPFDDFLQPPRSRNDDGSVPHVIRDGARVHTPSWTLVQPPSFPDYGFVEHRCSEQRCVENRDALLYEIGYLQALKKHEPVLRSWCEQKIGEKEDELKRRGIDRDRSDARTLDPQQLFENTDHGSIFDLITGQSDEPTAFDRTVAERIVDVRRGDSS